MELAPEFLHYALLNVRRLAETRPQAHGICGVLDNYLYATVKGSNHYAIRRAVSCAAQDALDAMFPRWPEFSGLRGYPVPAPKSSGLTPREAFGHALDLWDPEGEYGAARRRLLDWLIAETSPKREASAGTQVNSNQPNSDGPQGGGTNSLC